MKKTLHLEDLEVGKTYMDSPFNTPLTNAMEFLGTYYSVTEDREIQAWRGITGLMLELYSTVEHPLWGTIIPFPLTSEWWEEGDEG